MKKETVILTALVAFLVGFVTGATVAILKGKRGTMSSQVAPMEGPVVMEAWAKIQTLKERVSKEPKNLSAWEELGNLYFDSNQPQQAIEAYSRYLEIKPENPDVRTDMGIMYRKLGNPDRALEEFRRAAQSDPKHKNSRYNIGIVLLHDKQDIKGAVEAWEEYLKIDPESERAERVRAQMVRLKKMAK